jgi:hypothetical protein
MSRSGAHASRDARWSSISKAALAIIETLALVATQYQCGADTCCPFVKRDGTVAASVR